MNVVRWNPFRDMEAILNSVAQDNWGNEQLVAQDWRPHVEIRENGTHYTIALDVPAVQAKDIQVAVKDRVLTVSGERRDESETKDEKVHRIERRYGRFARSFVLPENANPDAIDANAKDGVLTIVIPKRENERPKSIEVRSH